MVAEHARGAGARGVYHCQESIWCEDEAFSLAALEAAVRAVFARHAALRTVFDLDSQPPLQWVRSGLRLDLQIEDISSLTQDAQDAHVLRALRADRARPFEVRDRDAPLLRAAVFLRSARGCDLALSAHHAVIDGWGHRLLTNQIWHAYAEAKAGRRPELGAPDSAQRQFAAYQEAVRGAPAAARYWRDYLEGVAEPVWPAPEAPETECDEPLVLRRLGTPLVAALRAAARASALPLQALALAAWVHTLREWSGQECVATGVVTNGRSEHVEGALSAVGLFWNIAPLVSRRSAAPIDLAGQVQRDLIEHQPYGAYPWPQILDDRGGRGLGGAVFRYLHFRNVEPPPAGAGLEIKDVVAYDRYSFALDYALLLHGRDADGHVMFQYDPAALGAAQALALVERYVAALRRFAPQSPAL
jgi:Condensation domain